MNYFIELKGIDKLISLIDLKDDSITNQLIPILATFAALKEVNEQTTKILKLYQTLSDNDEYIESILDGLDSFVFVGGLKKKKFFFLTKSKFYR